MLDDYADAFKPFDDEEVYVVFDDYWEQDEVKVCSGDSDKTDSTLCPLLEENFSKKTQPITVRELEQMQQIKMSQEFQRYVETQQYINSGIGTNKIYLTQVYGFLIDIIYAKDDIRCPADQQSEFLKDLQNLSTTNTDIDAPLDTNLWPDFMKSTNYNDLVARLIKRKEDSWGKKGATQLSLSVITASAIVFAQAML